MRVLAVLLFAVTLHAETINVRVRETTSSVNSLVVECPCKSAVRTP